MIFKKRNIGQSIYKKLKKKTKPIQNYFNEYKDFYNFLLKNGLMITPNIFKILIQAYITKDYLSLLNNQEIKIIAKKFIDKFISESPCELHAYNKNGTPLLKPCFMKYNAYNYLGPGTEFNTRYYELNQAGINTLDNAARDHDKVYYETKNEQNENYKKELRREADERLQSKAIHILRDSTNFNEFFYSLLTYIGMGIKLNL